MNPLETLSNEHGLIRQFLDNLTLSAQKIEGGQWPSRAFFEIAIDFARTFADKYHHFKEEHVLFVRLAEKKRGEVDAQLESLRYQHERGREHITAIANALDGYVERDHMKVTTMLESVAAYVSLLRHHIHVEDHIFYPLAKNVLAKNEMQELEERIKNKKMSEEAETKVRKEFKKLKMIMHSRILLCDGISNITSSIADSITLRSARAPTSRTIAERATARKASSVNWRWVFSIWKNCSYCLMSAFLGSVRMRTIASSSSSSNDVMHGSRPTSSGIIPKCTKSSGWTCARMSLCWAGVSAADSSEAKPMS